VITRANVKPGGNDIRFLHHAVHAVQAQINHAARIDREADFQLSLGRHAAAERLAHRALELRGAA
jgi:hypothetical protein